MSYPIPLGRYDQIRVETMRVKMNIDPLTLTGEDPARWEVIGVTATAEAWLLLIGRVRAGLKVRTIEDG